MASVNENLFNFNAGILPKNACIVIVHTEFTHGFDEIFGDQQRQVELAQAAIFTLGLDELDDVRVVNVKGGHLGTAAATGRRYGEAHAVEDIHERQRAGSSGAGAGHIGTTGAQGGEFIADSTASLEGKACFVVFLQNVIHGVVNAARHGAVDGRGRGLVGLGSGIGGDTARQIGSAHV